MSIYYDKEVLLNEGKLCFLTEEEIKTKPYLIYEGEDYFEGIVYIDGDRLRNPTVEEEIEMGLIKLEDGQYVENNEIITVYPDSSILKPHWNTFLKRWMETATEEEIETHKAMELEHSLYMCKKALINLELEIMALERIGLPITEGYTLAKEELMSEHIGLCEIMAMKLNK